MLALFSWGVALPSRKCRLGEMCREPVVGQLAGHLLGSLVPAGHVVNQHHAAVGAGAQGPRQVGVYHIAFVSLNQNRFRNHAFVAHSGNASANIGLSVAVVFPAGNGQCGSIRL